MSVLPSYSVQKKSRLHGCELEESLLIYASFEEVTSDFYKKSRLRKIVMHVDEVLCHGENGGATWETSHRCCIMRRVVSKEVTARGRFHFFWTLPS